MTSGFKYKVIPLLLILATILTCCKKENTAINRVKGVVIAKWRIDSIVSIQRLNNTVKKESLTGDSGDYIEFTNDGKMRTRFRGNNDVSNYSVKDENTLIIDGDSAFILELTEKKFILNTKASAGSLGSIEITYYLKQ